MYVASVGKRRDSWAGEAIHRAAEKGKSDHLNAPTFKIWQVQNAPLHTANAMIPTAEQAPNKKKFYEIKAVTSDGELL